MDPFPREEMTDNNSASADTNVTDTITEGPAPPKPRSPSTGQTPKRSPTAQGVAPSALVAPKAARGLPKATPTTASELWVIDAATGVGAPLVIPPPCPPSRACPPTRIEGRVPAWSPDGLRIAYEDSGSVRLATLTDADGDKVADRPETASGIAAVTGFAAVDTPTPSRPELSAATDPAWSPDGAELAVAGQPAGQPDQSGIYALRPDGTAQRTVAQGRGPETEPAWQPFADVSVEITANPAAVPPGSETNLAVTARNAGPAPAVEVTLRVGIPPGLSPGDLPPGCAPTTVDREFTCSVGELGPGADKTFVLPATGDITGAHTVVATVSTPTPDRVPDNNTDSVIVTVSESVADLAVTLTATPAAGVQPLGSTLMAKVTNAGPQPVTVADLRIELPPGLTPSGTPTGCLPDTDRAVTCAVGPLTVGQTAERSWSVTGALPGAHTATARVTSPTADPKLDNNVATATITRHSDLRRPRCHSHDDDARLRGRHRDDQGHGAQRRTAADDRGDADAASPGGACRPDRHADLPDRHRHVSDRAARPGPDGDVHRADTLPRRRHRRGDRDRVRVPGRPGPDKQPSDGTTQGAATRAPSLADRRHTQRRHGRDRH